MKRMRVLFSLLILAATAIDLTAAQTVVSPGAKKDFVTSQFVKLEQVARSAAAFVELMEQSGDLSPLQLWQLLKANVDQDSRIYGSTAAFEPDTYPFDSYNMSTGVPKTEEGDLVIDAQTSTSRDGFPRRVYSPYVFRGAGFRENPNQPYKAVDIAYAYDYIGTEAEVWYADPRASFNDGTFPSRGWWSSEYFDQGAGNITMVTFAYPILTADDLTELGNVERNGKWFRGVMTIDVPIGIIHERQNYEYPQSLQVSVFAGVVAVELYVIYILMKIIAHRTDRLVMATSAFFNFFILFASIVLLLVALVFIAPPDDKSILCNLRLWATSLCVLGVYLPLFVKTWRIDKIFSQGKLHSLPPLTDSKMMKGVAFFMGIQVFILTVVTIIPSQRTHYELVENDDISSEEDGYFNVRECSISLFGTALSIIYIGSLAIYGTYLAFRVRHVPSSFNETTHIAVAMAFFFFYMCIILPLEFFFTLNDPEMTAWVRSMGVIFGVFFTVSAIFLPKIDFIRQGKSNDPKHVQTSMKTGNSKSLDMISSPSGDAIMSKNHTSGSNPELTNGHITTSRSNT